MSGSDGASLAGSIENPEGLITIKVPERMVEAVLLRLPLIPLKGSEKHGYIGTRLDIRLTQRQARPLKSVFDGLHEIHEKTANGRHVDRTRDAVHWILDRIADVFESNQQEPQ